MNQRLTRVAQGAIGVLKRFVPVVSGLRWMNKGVRAFARLTHRLQFIVEWAADSPEYFDHFLDQHYLWAKSRNGMAWERGVMSRMALTAEAEVLDLCCGDGFYSFHFYSLASKSVTAIDFDKDAIRWARRNFRAQNLTYIVGDIRTDIPDGPFTNVIWDAAIEHFDESEIDELMTRIRSVLTPDGTLSGYTLEENGDGSQHLHQHEYEFKSKQDLARFLTPYFKNVQVFSTSSPGRTNLYFYATDGDLPFHRDGSLTVLK